VLNTWLGADSSLAFSILGTSPDELGSSLSKLEILVIALLDLIGLVDVCEPKPVDEFFLINSEGPQWLDELLYRLNKLVFKLGKLKLP
jgi:hypothetical protein